jgi:hypothetical protein
VSYFNIKDGVFTVDPVAREQERLDSAVATYHTEVGKLYRSDGQPKYGPAEMDERKAALLASVEQAVERTKQRAAEIEEEAAADLSRLNADPTAGLSSSDLEIATLKAQFVKEDLQRLSPAALEQRLETVIIDGDKVTKWLYHRYAGQLAGDIRDSSQRSGTAGATLTDEQSTRLGILTRAVAQLEQQLVDKSAKERAAAAEERKRKALVLGSYAGAKLRALYGEDPAVNQQQWEHAIF